MQCPKQIAEALIKVKSQVKPLIHDAKNEFNNYGYTSIDGYYEQLRPLLVDAGLLIIPTEESAQVAPDQKTLKVTFSFYLVHESGEVWDFPIRRTVYLNYGGAQSCGSALSYAEKFVLRTLFKIPTGEADAEAQATHAPDADSMPRPYRGEEPKVDFNFAGAPYRIFTKQEEVSRSFSDVKSWGMALKTATQKDESLLSANQKEIERVYKDATKSKTLTDPQKRNLLKALDPLMEKING